MEYVDAVLDGVSNIDPLSEVEPVEGLNRTSVLMTEKELKAMVSVKNEIHLTIHWLFKGHIKIYEEKISYL